MHTMLHNLCHGEYVMSLSTVELSDKGQVRWWSSAAPPPLVFRNDGRIETVACSGTPLGDDTFVPGRKEFALQPGERMLLCTDGVLELPLEDGRELGQRRLKKLVASLSDLPVDVAMDKLEEELAALYGERSQEDDMTLILVEHAG